jgi:hypothetical protein
MPPTALIDTGQATLARRAVVRRDALADFKNGSRRLSPDNLAAIRAALKAAGVIFHRRERRGAWRQAAEEARAVRAEAKGDNPAHKVRRAAAQNGAQLSLTEALQLSEKINAANDRGPPSQSFLHGCAWYAW